jgi:polysaccharide biosynthesis/export protein
VKKILFSLVLAVILSACNAYKDVAYVQSAGAPIQFGNVSNIIPEPTIKIGDLLIITVNSTTPESSVPFNLPLVPTGMNSYSVGQHMSTAGGLQNYLVDTEGYINFPILGMIKAVGLSKTELVEKIKEGIYPKYIKEEPVITLRYVNFKISVLGEVKSSGVFYINNEKISILEAISMAGDLSIFGRRDNVLLIRENINGERQTVRLDLRDERLISSEYYFLQQNDVIYVQPNDARSRSSALSTAETFTVSIVGTLISLSALIINLLR